ncbi:MAG: hypothetical protein OXH68_14590 [Gammaproteobacteria bacterium]|nr:hypothetical protein [Gammaproteobacteria bacterium]
MKYRSKNRQKGVTLPEMGLYVGVLAVLGVVVAANWGNVQAGIKIEQAFAEIVKVMGAAQAYRAAPANSGSYTGVTVTVLENNGYNVRPFTTGTNQNTYGLTVAVVAAGTPAGSDATLTYQVGIAEDCEQLEARFQNTAGVKGTPACGTTTPITLTLTLE